MKIIILIIISFLLNTNIFGTILRTIGKSNKNSFIGIPPNCEKTTFSDDLLRAKVIKTQDNNEIAIGISPLTLPQVYCLLKYTEKNKLLEKYSKDSNNNSKKNIELLKESLIASKKLLKTSTTLSLKIETMDKLVMDKSKWIIKLIDHKNKSHNLNVGSTYKKNVISFMGRKYSKDEYYLSTVATINKGIDLSKGFKVIISSTYPKNIGTIKLEWKDSTK